MSRIREIVATLDSLSVAELEETIRGLRAMLDVLPADDASNADVRLRSDLSVLLAGYDAGRRSAGATDSRSVRHDA